MDLPLVATNDVYFPKSEMYEAHDALICIADGAYVDQQDPPPPDGAALFEVATRDGHACLPTCLRRLKTPSKSPSAAPLRPIKRDPILPKFADDEVDELRRQAQAGLQGASGRHPACGHVEEYEKRLDFELDIIEGMGFPGYFLIVADFIKWAKDNASPLGPAVVRVRAVWWPMR